MKVNSGFSLIELLVVLTISAVLLTLITRIYDANHRLFLTNKALTELAQEGQYIIPFLNSNISSAGYSNDYLPELNRLIDTDLESEFITKNPVVSGESFSAFPLIKSVEGEQKSDQIVINTIAAKTCTGTNFDFNDGELFHAVNHYYIDGTTLRCKSYDGRYLRGVKLTTTSNYSVSLLENVQDMQIQYGVQFKGISVDESDQLSWVNADVLANINKTATADVKLVAVNVALLLGKTLITPLAQPTQIKLLGNDHIERPKQLILRKFETMIVLQG